MSKEKFYRKPHLGIIIPVIVMIGLFIIFILSYVIYNFVFSGKIYKTFPSSSDGFIEFNLGDMNIIKDYFSSDYIPWYYSYSDKLNENDKGAILFYKGEKIDVLEVGMRNSGMRLLNGIKHESEHVIESGSYITLSQSSMPICIYKRRQFFCSDNKEILNDILENTSVMRDNSDFINVENNLHRGNMLFTYFSSEYIKNFYYLEGRFKSAGISLKKRDQNIDGIFYGISGGENERHEREVRKYNLESYINTKDGILFFGGRNFQKQFNEMIDNISYKKPYLILLAKGLLDGKLKEFFGGGLKFIDDVLPLFSGEFLVAIKEIDNIIHLELILEKTNSINYLLENFEKESKKYMPKQEEYQFGSYDLKHISSDSENIENIDTMKRGKKIKGWTIKGKDHGLYLIEENSIIRISTSLKSLESGLAYENTSLKDLLPYSPYSYDFGYANFPKLNSLIEIMEDEPVSYGIKAVSWQSMGSNNGIQIKFKIY